MMEEMEVETTATAATAASAGLRGETGRGQADRGDNNQQTIRQNALHGSILQTSVKQGKPCAIRGYNACHLRALHKLHRQREAAPVALHAA
jgi:hypothetical protein